MVEMAAMDAVYAADKKRARGTRQDAGEHRLGVPSGLNAVA